MEGHRGLLVRRADLDDVGVLAQLRWNWRVGAGERPAGSLHDFTADLARWQAERAASHHPFLAFDGDRPAGIGWLALVDRVPGPERWERRSGLVQALYVEADLRDRGIGSQLLGSIVAHARALGLEYLTVHPTERSVPFYRRHGFAVHDRALELRW